MFGAGEVGMRPYVIKQGDHLQQLAFQLGFNADAVWNDPSNGDLQKLRKDPNILAPGDVLQIPDDVVVPPTYLAVGTTNPFTSDPPTIPLNVQFTSFDPTTYASKAFTVVELPGLPAATTTTDNDGAASFPIPVTLTTATVVFTDSGDTFVLAIAEMDPINTLSGIFKRLQNLGYIGKGALFDATNLETIRAGLRYLKETKGDASTPPAASSAPPDSSPASSPAPASAPDSGAPASPPSSSQPPASQPSPSQPTPSQPSPSQPAPSQPPTSQPAASAADASSDGPASSSPSPDSSPSSSPSSTPPGGDNTASADDAGLADDGTLAVDVQELLIKAHGC